MEDRKQLHELLRQLGDERDASKVYEILENILRLMQAKHRDQKKIPEIAQIQPHASQATEKSNRPLQADHRREPQKEN